MEYLIAHKDDCAIIVNGPTTKTTHFDMNTRLGGPPLPKVTVPTLCTCGGVRVRLADVPEGHSVEVPLMVFPVAVPLDDFELRQREMLEAETAKRQARVDEEALTGDPIGDSLQRAIQRAREIKGDG